MVLVPDNLKSAVTKADKSIVERHLQIVYQQIFAPLRHMTFFSTDDINAAIKEPLKRLNERLFQGRLN